MLLSLKYFTKSADGLYEGCGHPGEVPPFGHRHPGAGGDHPGHAPGRVRRAGGHQSAAGGPGHPGDISGGHPGRGQGGLPALGDVADPDHRAGGAKRRRHRDFVRRRHYAVHAPGHGRDGAPPGKAGCVQQGPRHRAQDGEEGGAGADGPVRRGQAGLQRQEPVPADQAPADGGHRQAGEGDEGGRQDAGVRGGGGVAGSDHQAAGRGEVAYSRRPSTRPAHSMKPTFTPRSKARAPQLSFKLPM